MQVDPGWPPWWYRVAILLSFSVFFPASSTQPVLPVVFFFLLLPCVLTMRFSTTLVSAAAFFELCIAGYVLEDDYMTDFYGKFNFFTGKDPTNGSYGIHYHFGQVLM